MNNLKRPVTAPELYSQDGKGHDAVVHAHYFVGSCDWLVTEFDGTDLAFGWARLNGDDQNAELGYVSLAELDSIRVPLRVSVGDDMAQPIVLGYATVEHDEGWPEGLTLTEGIALVNERQGR